MEEESKEEGDGKKKEGRSILQGSPPDRENIRIILY